QRNHDDGGGEVVEDGGKKKRDDANDPEEFCFRVGLNEVGDFVKSFVGVDEFDDGHGAHEEEKNFGDGGEVFAELVEDSFCSGAIVKNVDKPAADTEQNSGSSLVHTHLMFK